ncbi:type II secretion system F family protein [Candidatus Micrarchaeota archaeon]|nr:type II secretion system F family protein [Candidatus Micrarchaeota archaeon]MBU2475960.1 type II secretion system F family protein [Candidatus Micrarchaeota archaeon]
MANVDKLRKVIEEKQKKGQQKASVDMEEVEKIVERMKKRYSEEGMEMEEVGGRLKELRGIIAEGKQKELEVQTAEDLKVFTSPLIRNLGKFYLSLRAIMKPIEKLISKLPQVKQLSFYLYSANMKISANQFLAILTSIALIVFVVSIVLLSALVFAFFPEASMLTKSMLVLLVSLLLTFMTIIIGFLIPRRKAMSRGDEVSKELPFALRHMATELKSGLGLYRTIQTIAMADYGALSEEFSRTINEIEEGTDTKLALRHLALRTQSKALRNSLIHVIRALRTGGNLSVIMNDIADDVSFSLRMKIKDFAQKMNFFATIFIYMAIVIPVFVSILGGIKITPIQSGSVFQSLPLGIPVLMAFFLVFMPMLLTYLVFFISLSQPKV